MTLEMRKEMGIPGALGGLGMVHLTPSGPPRMSYMKQKT